MKRIILAAAIAGLPDTGHAQIPVTDASAIFQQIKSVAQEAKAYALQAQQYLTEAQTLKQDADMAAGFLHDPNLGAAMALINRTGYGNSLPINPAQLQSLAMGNAGMSLNGMFGKLQQLGGLVNTNYGQNHIYSPTDGSFQSNQLIANGNQIAGAQGMYQSAYEDIRAHLPVIQALQAKLATSPNPKDTADATAALQAEAVWTANLDTSLRAAEANYRAEQDSRVQRENESLDKGIDTFLAQAKAAGRGL